MADIFVSYASADRKWAQLLADGFGARGWTVWWDRDIPVGQTFQSVIDQALRSSRAVSVVWSQASIASHWVLEEAEEGRKSKRLFPVLVEGVDVPLGFRMLQAADLKDWQGDASHQGFQSLVRSMESVLGVVQVLAYEEAIRLIQRFSLFRKVSIANIEGVQTAVSSTKYVSAPTMDKMGCVYCHVSGSRSGEVYYVRKGISLYYHHIIGGALIIPRAANK